MFARQPSAPEPAGGATNRPGLFTQMFSQMNLGDASMAAPGGQSPAAGSPMGSPDSLLGASRAPGTPPSVPPAKPVALGEFTRMFESTSPPAAPAPESVVGAPSPRPYLPPVAPTVRAVPDGPSQYTLSLQRIPLPAQPALPAAPAPEQTPTRPPARRLIALIVVGTILVLAAVLIFYTGRP